MEEEGFQKIEMDGGILWGRPRPGRGCSAIYGWMDFSKVCVENSDFIKI
jgi:hypothetical protein